MSDPTPALQRPAFRCPHCGDRTQQDWYSLRLHEVGELLQSLTSGRTYAMWRAARCFVCEDVSVWHGDRMVYPGASSAPLPHVDMPAGPAELYSEAREVLPHSRRAAAALMRGSLERLLREVEGSDKRLDEMIAALSGRVTPPLWQLLTALRVLGNTSLHEGENANDLVVMYLDGDETAAAEPFFAAVNLLVDELITRPRQASEIYGLIPATKRAEAERKAGVTLVPPTALATEDD